MYKLLIETETEVYNTTIKTLHTISSLLQQIIENSFHTVITNERMKLEENVEW